MPQKTKLPSIRLLRYTKGDLILKEGDYGAALYKIKKGKVQVFSESGNREILLATLGPGDILGEMTFLKGLIEPRSASARCLDECELEAWHFFRIKNEYEQMPPVIRTMVDQALERLVRMNRVLVQLDIKRQKREQQEGVIPKDPQRLYYRKDVSLDCDYTPLDSSSRLRLKGIIKNISMNGLGLDIPKWHIERCSHEPGQVFHLRTILPTGKELNTEAKVISIDKNRKPGRLFLGMAFMGLREGAKKRLGFFLLP